MPALKLRSLSLALLLLQPGWLVVVLSEPISTGIAVGSALFVGTFLGAYELVKCKFYECCDDSWIAGAANITSLKQQLDKRLYGQHLVIDTLVAAVHSHFKNANPDKALVLSFHGWTGGGKNYVSQITAESMYKRAVESKFVHLFSATLHFPHASEVQKYKDQLSQWVRGNVSQCARSLFIFDEVDKMPDGLLDAIKPFIDHNAFWHGADYRKAIFIFLSNTGGNDITSRTLDYWLKGQRREDIKLKEMEDLIIRAAFNERGGLQFSALIKSHLVDHFIPFLPLEREHVRLCIRDYFLARNVSRPSDEQIDAVAAQLQYFPKERQLYSSSGCKRIPPKVELLLQQEAANKREENAFGSINCVRYTSNNHHIDNRITETVKLL